MSTVDDKNVLRFRIRISKDTPALLDRLSGDKATNQEVLYLLRLGLLAESRLTSELNFVQLSAVVGGSNVIAHTSTSEPKPSSEDGALVAAAELGELVDLEFFTP